MVSRNFIILILFFPQAIGQFLTFLYWIQLKEYRPDRFLVFFKSQDGVQELFLIPIIFKFIILLSSIFFYSSLVLYLLLALSLDLIFGYLFLNRRLRKPVFTQRVVRITGITLIIILFLALIVRQENLYFLLSEASLFIGLLVGCYLTDITAKRTLSREMLRTEELLGKYSPVVIAITGSYGKTTTKDFITQLLSTENNVLSTYKNQNTHFGIVRKINTDLVKDHKYLIVEIGAYKTGEISKITSILKPSVAVITGIEPQHLELFGTYDNLKKAKFELIESLMDGGSAIFNLTNPEVAILLSRAEKLDKKLNIFTYAVGRKGVYDASSKIISNKENGITFEIVIGKDTRIISSNLVSPSLVENLTCAIFIARNFGVSWLNIEKCCAALLLPEGTLNIFKTDKGLTVINDSYNATPHSFKAALDVLKSMKAEKKVVFTTGIIELGDRSYAVHKDIGESMANSCDHVFLRNRESLSALRAGIANNDKISLVTDPQKMIALLDSFNRSGNLILIEGKLPQLVSSLKRK